jgi:hypothetical protein
MSSHCCSCDPQDCLWTSVMAFCRDCDPTGEDDE